MKISKSTVIIFACLVITKIAVTMSNTKTNHASKYNVLIPNSGVNDTIKPKDTLSATAKIDTSKIKLNRCERSAGLHFATWYRTEGHKKVHRQHPTAAYNHAPLGTQLRVTNTANNKSCVVTVTDRMGNKSRKTIDLSHSAFGEIADHASGNIRVEVVIID